MDSRNQKDHTNLVSKSALIFGMPAALLGGFRISFGLCFILVSFIFGIWTIVSYIDQKFVDRYDTIYRSESPISYWFRFALVSIFAAGSFVLGLIALFNGM